MQQETQEVVDEDLDEVFRYIAYIKLHPIYASPSQSLDYCMQEILGIKAVMVNQHKMLHDTRRMMTEVKSSYRSMLNRIVSLEREVRVSLRVHMTIMYVIYIPTILNNLVYSQPRLNSIL